MKTVTLLIFIIALAPGGASATGYNKKVPTAKSREHALPTTIINVTQYGAVGDGVTDDTLAIRNAIAAAKATSGGAQIYFPTGTYAICPQNTDPGWTPQDITSTTAGGVLDLSASNLAIVGDGETKSIISFYTLGLTDPVTHWWVTTDSYEKIKRGGPFQIVTPSSGAGLSNIQFQSIRVTGNAPATGDPEVGGDPTTGDGWDLTNKGIIVTGETPVAGLIFEKCEFDDFRGEILYRGGTTSDSISIINVVLHDTNADAISMSADVYIENSEISAMYNGIENFALNGNERTVLIGTTLNGTINSTGVIAQNGVVFIGVDASGLYMSGNTISNCTGGVYLAEFANNLTIQSNTFNNDVTAVYWSALGLYPQITSRNFNNNWIDSNLFEGSAMYDAVCATFGNENQENLVISNNTLTIGTGTFFFKDESSETLAQRSGFKIYGNTMTNFSGQPEQDANGIASARALWYSNTYGPNISVPYASNYSSNAVILQIAPGFEFFDIGYIGNAGTTVSISAAIGTYPTGFNTTIIGVDNEGSDQPLTIGPDSSWNNFTTSYVITYGAKLQITMDSNGKFDAVSYTAP